MNSLKCPFMFERIPNEILIEVTVWVLCIDSRSTLTLRLINKKWLEVCNKLKVEICFTVRWPMEYFNLEDIIKHMPGNPLINAAHNLEKWIVFKNTECKYQIYLPWQWKPLFSGSEIIRDQRNESLVILIFDAYSTFVNIKNHAEKELGGFWWAIMPFIRYDEISMFKDL